MPEEQLPNPTVNLDEMTPEEIYRVLEPILTEDEKRYLASPEGKESLEIIKRLALEILGEGRRDVPPKEAQEALIDAAAKRLGVLQKVRVENPHIAIDGKGHVVTAPTRAELRERLEELREP